MTALAIAERNFNSNASVLCRVTLVWLRFEAGEYFDVAADISPLLTPEAMRNPLNEFVCRSILARAHVGAGRLDDARAQLDAIERRIAEGIVIESPVRPHYLLARCEERLASFDLEAARMLAEELQREATPAPDRQFLAFAHEVLAKISRLEGDPGAAARHLARGLRLVRGGGLPLPARKLYAATAQHFEALGRRASMTALQRRARTVISTLADSLNADDPLLRAAFFAQQETKKGRAPG